MKILKSKTGLLDRDLTKFVNDNQIAKEDILFITSDRESFVSNFNIFYYEEPKPEDNKKGFWG